MNAYKHSKKYRLPASPKSLPYPAPHLKCPKIYYINA